MVVEFLSRFFSAYFIPAPTELGEDFWEYKWDMCKAVQPYKTQLALVYGLLNDVTDMTLIELQANMRHRVENIIFEITGGKIIFLLLLAK